MKYLSIFFIVVMVAAAGYLFFSDDIMHFFKAPRETLHDVFSSNSLDPLREAISQQLEKEVVIVPPLVTEVHVQSSVPLTVEGVLMSTNAHRAKEGLHLLELNATLSAAAEKRMEDMFSRQYFDHTSPDGKEFARFIEEEEYSYVRVAENIALGNFEGDVLLVQAWMDSPGHRKNILDQSYTEIGIAVGKGVFEGDTVWIGVQLFGRPTNVCSEVDQSLKNSIEVNTNQLETLSQTLHEQKKEIDSYRRCNAACQEKVEQYNLLVEEYNHLASQTQEIIDSYNAQIAAFNACAAR